MSAFTLTGVVFAVVHVQTFVAELLVITSHEHQVAMPLRPLESPFFSLNGFTSRGSAADETAVSTRQCRHRSQGAVGSQCPCHRDFQLKRFNDYATSLNPE